jgi:hypothetical protein
MAKVPAPEETGTPQTRESLDAKIPQKSDAYRRRAEVVDAIRRAERRQVGRLPRVVTYRRTGRGGGRR